MSPIVPHAVFLACLFACGVARAREPAVPIIAEHEATFVGDEVRWNTRLVMCGDPPFPYGRSTVEPVERTGETVRLHPPYVDDAPFQVVLLHDPNLVFLP